MGMAIETVNEWYDLQIEKLRELHPELDKTTDSYNDAGKALDELTEKTEAYIKPLMTLSEVIESQATKWDALKAAMAEGVGGFGYGPPPPSFGYQQGTPYVPKTGMYKLHKGEAVTPAGQNTYNQQKSYSVNINNPVVRNEGDIAKIRREVEKALNESTRQYGRRGYELAV
ncbi:hypothetical protein ES705_42016 [subsurface metagenome]